MRRHALSDEQWTVIEPLVPPPKDTGRPRRDARQMADGMLWCLRTGAPWRDLPDRFGPWQTVYHWFNTWGKDGTLDRILEALQIRLDDEGHIDWDLWCVDGSHIRASRAAAGAGKRGAMQNPENTLWAARAADSAANCTWSLTVAACPSPPRSRQANGTNRRSSRR